MQIFAFIGLLIISIAGFVLGLMLDDPLLMMLSWISSVGFFLFTVLDALGVIDSDY